MAVTKWLPAAAVSVLTTELNTLASGGISALGPVYDNTTGLYLFADFQVDVTFAIAPTANLPILINIIPALDGSNFGFGSAGNQWLGFNRGGFQMMAITTQQLLEIQGIPIPPLKFKLQMQNGTNQVFPASGTTLKMVPYQYQTV